MFAQSLGSLIVHLRANTTQYVAAMQGAEAIMAKTARTMMAIGSRLSATIALPLALVGGMSVKAFGDFDDAMTKSLAIMGDINRSMRSEMEDTAKTIAGRSVTSATDLAQSYFYLASAGLTAKQSVKALATTEAFAVAGAFDMGRATDLLTDAQSALGLATADANQNMINMTRISDVLVRANTLANASVEQFSSALTNKAAAALRMLNKDVEEGVAVLAAFADQGVKDQVAGEKLYIVLRDLQRAVIKQADVWAKMNLSVYDAEGAMLPLADIIEQLENRFGGMTDKQKKMTAEMLGFQDRSFIAIQNLIGMSSQIKMYEKELRKAGGTTNEVASKQLESFNAQMKILKNNIELAGIEIGGELAPTLGSLASGIQKLVVWFRNLDDGTKQFIVTSGVVAAIASVVVLVFGLMAKAILAIVSLFKIISLVALKFVAVAAIVVAAVVAVTDALTGGSIGVLEWVKSFRLGGLKIGTYIDMISSYIVEAWEWAVTISLGLWETWKTSMLSLGGKVYRGFLHVAQGIASVWDYLFGTTTASYDKMIEKSLAAENKRVKELRKTLKGLGSEQLEQSNRWEQARKKMLDEDIAERQQQETRKHVQDKMVETQLKMMNETTKAAKKITGETSSSGPTASDSQFKSMSLRRFDLSPVVSTQTKKQEVKDTAALNKLEEIRQLLSNKTLNVAQLG